MRNFGSVSDLESALGKTLGTSSWRPIDQDQVNVFAMVTDDEQWIHVDEQRASAGPFGAPIAHGYLLLALIPSLLTEVVEFEGMAMTVNYGLERVRFPAPVRVGSHIRATASLAGITSTASGHRLTVQVVIETEGGTKPSCVAEVLILVVP